MRVAALYDVHAMPWALEAVLQEVEAEAVDLLIFGGDLIGGPSPAQTLALARRGDALFVRGNGEREPDEWDRHNLDPSDLRWLEELPISVSIDGVLYCHSTPNDDLPLITAATPAEAVAELFAGMEEKTAVIGHTHHQFDRRIGGIRVINAGSVGMPYENAVAAFWALLEDGEPSFRETPFDLERAIAEIEASGWPQAAAFVAENVRGAPSREEAIAYFEGLRP